MDSSNQPSKKPRMDVPNVREPEVDEGAEASITEPDDFDVLFGRGKGNQYHFGNRRYQDIVDANKTRYFEATSRHEKILIVQQVVLEVAEKGRFLKLNDQRQGWVQVSEAEARHKVAQTLQYYRRNQADGDRSNMSDTASNVAMGSLPEAKGSHGQRGSTSLTMALLQEAVGTPTNLCLPDSSPVARAALENQTQFDQDATSSNVETVQGEPANADPEYVSLIQALSQGKHLDDDGQKKPPAT